MGLRDDLAAVLGPGNDDAAGYAQADAALAAFAARGHAERAEVLLDAASTRLTTPAGATTAAAAQAQATLAVAEQVKRVADWLESVPRGYSDEPLVGRPS